MRLGSQGDTKAIEYAPLSLSLLLYRLAAMLFTSYGLCPAPIIIPHPSFSL